MKFIFDTYRYLLFSLCSILIYLGYYFSLEKGVYPIFPSPQFEQYNLDVYREDFSDTASLVNFNVHSDSIVINYTLSPFHIDPFAAFYLRQPNKHENILETHLYDSFKITMKSKYGKRHPLIFKFDNYKKIGNTNVNDWITYTCLLEPTEKGKVYTYDFPLEEFKIPSWWLRKYDVEIEEESIREYNELRYLILERCEALAPNFPDEIVVYEMSFYKNYTQKAWWAFWVMLGFNGVMWGYKWWRKKKNKVPLTTNVYVPVAPLEIRLNSNANDKLTKIKAFIGENYHDCNLSVKKLQEATGIYQREISAVFREEMHTTFNNYLNLVRISEVKRLLKETDIAISEIAYKSGYNQIPHFNRVFKKETGLSPKQFREKHQHLN